MARKKGQLPAYRQHKSSGRGYVYLDGKQHLLPGAFRSAESIEAYQRLVAEWTANGCHLDQEEAAPYGIGDLVMDFLAHADVFYRRKDGSPTHEASNIETSMRELLELYRSLPAKDFDLAKLKVVRDAMVRARKPTEESAWGPLVAPRRPGDLTTEAGGTVPGPQRLARSTINARVARIVRMFAWAAEELKVPASVYGELRALRTLRRGRSQARETEPRRPVAWVDVAAVLPRLPQPLQGLVRFLWATGARVGEAVQLRGRDIDRSGQVWLFEPQQHKLLHRDKPRIIAIGKDAQAALAPFVKLDPDAYWFSPAETMALSFRARRAKRKSKLWPSHLERYRREAKLREARRDGDRYDTRAVSHAIRRACRLQGVPIWSPHALRHAALTRIRREMGIEAAAAIAGHSAVTMTDRYSHEAQKSLAVRVASEIG